MLCLRLFPVLLLIALTACVGARTDESVATRALLPMEAIDRVGGTTTPAKNTGDTVDILALSAGGGYGAYGVGVLSGWSERGDRPQFDIVTGVSTGALMSVFAFLGPQYDDMLKELYLNVDREDILTDRGVAGLFGDSLYDNTPLKRQIERVVTPELLAAVAAEHAKGRRLYVATVNLDAAQLVVWDMGDIANGGRSDPLQHFQKVLRASAAVPGFFQPVYIKPQRGVQLRQAHVDGGVKAPLLVSDFLFRMPARQRNLYVIINDSIQEADPSSPVKPALADIARKTIATLTRKLMIETVYRSYIRASHSGTRFHLNSIDGALAGGAGTLEFDRAKMRQLYEAGRASVLSSTPWQKRPPQLLNFDIARR